MADVRPSSSLGAGVGGRGKLAAGLGRLHLSLPESATATVGVCGLAWGDFGEHLEIRHSGAALALGCGGCRTARGAVFSATGRSIIDVAGVFSGECSGASDGVGPTSCGTRDGSDRSDRSVAADRKLGFTGSATRSIGSARHQRDAWLLDGLGL